MATKAAARGSISFIDLNDGKSMSLYLTSNHATTQLHYIDGIQGYSPDYESNDPLDTENGPLVITPNLFITGSVENQIGNIIQTPHWTINGIDINTEAAPDTRASGCPVGVSFATSGSYTLTISKNNVVNAPQMVITCSVKYYDSETYATTAATAQITITKMDVAPGTIVAWIRAIDNPIITDETGSIRLQCLVRRGNKPGNMTAGDDDGGQFSFQWFREDDPAGADAYEWHKIVSALSPNPQDRTGTLDTGDQWEEILPDGITGYDTDVITIPASTITNIDAFSCLVTDIEAGSATNGFQIFTGAFGIQDRTDVYSVDFDSPAGTIITRGTTSISTKVSVWHKGEEMNDDVQNRFNYLWTKADKDGNVVSGDTSNPVTYKHGAVDGTPDANWSVQNPLNESSSTYCRYAVGASVGESARRLTVYKNEVQTKATFKVEVYIPQRS